MTKYTFIFGDILFPNPKIHDNKTYVSNYIEVLKELTTEEEAEEYAEEELNNQACDSYIIKELYTGDLIYINHD